MNTQMQSLTTAMTDSISNVLETMFFLPVDIDGVVRAETLQHWQDGSIVAARLHFSGPLKGASMFCIPKKTAVYISADFLGTNEQDVTEDQAVATVKEIANMLTGDTFSRFDPQAVFNLAIPEQINSREALGSTGLKKENEITLSIRAMEDHLAFRIVFESFEVL